LCGHALNVALERSTSLPQQGFALFGGLSRVAWVAAHVGRLYNGLEKNDGDDNVTADYDVQLLKYLRSNASLLQFDLISGLVGIGVYCLERLPSPSARASLSLILAELERRADLSWGGAAWLTPAAHTSTERAERWPSGYFDLGVAHGTPGVLFLLSEICDAGVSSDRAERLLDQGLSWLLARRRPPSCRTRFGNWFIPGDVSRDSRLGWCYGDLGIAAVLIGIASRTGRKKLLLFSRALLERLAAVECNDGHLSDMMLCHGSLGVAHIFARVFNLTRDDSFRFAADRWCVHGLSQRRRGAGVCGFYSYIKTATPSTTTDYSMLTGAAGCGLALLSLGGHIPPEWDRVLLLSPTS
jgi:hypothetical protein